MRTAAQPLSLGLLALYVAVFPGSTIIVALDRVPAWGVWMGSALLIVQGATTLAWLAGRYGRRGLAAGVLVGMLAWLVEYAGVQTGLPFGRYAYTGVLQPHLFGSVPLAICCAWMAVVPAAYELARRIPIRRLARHPLLTAATLVLLLDLQIETVAAANQYWIWFDHGSYYDVPPINFAAWWLVGFGMAWVLSLVCRPQDAQPSACITTGPPCTPGCLARHISCATPALIYGMNVTMFTVINLARGYTLAGMVGMAMLAAAGRLFIHRLASAAGNAGTHRRHG